MVLSLFEEVMMFLAEKGQPVDHFADTNFICHLVFLIDICGHLNEFNKTSRKS